jgi:site-specific recombinase XerD
MKKGITLAEFHREYIEYRKPIREASTILADDLALRKFEDHVGRDRLLPQIKPRHCDTFMSKCAQAGLKPSSSTNHYRHLHTAFEKAVVWDLLEENPLSKIKPPPHPQDATEIHSHGGGGIIPSRCRRLRLAHVDNGIFRHWPTPLRIAQHEMGGY